MEELLVIVGAELILLISIALMRSYNKRADVLSHVGRLDQIDHAVSDSRSTARLRLRTWRERAKIGPRALPARRRPKKKIPQNRQSSPGGRITPVNPESDGLADRPPENGIAQGYRVRASLPDGIRIYAVGDIHGRSDLLSQLLECIEADRRQRPVERAITVFVGDYIDRGPYSRHVIDLLLRWRENNEAIFLRGNHETFLTRFLSDPKTLENWRQRGGLETLLSYGLQPTINPDRDEQGRLAEQLASSLPKAHLDFLESLKPSYSCGDFLFVHAGIRPGIPIAQQSEQDMLWMREEFLAYEQPFEQFVVHGHTAVAALDLRSNRINIDTGAFATGRLTCIVIEGCVITQLPASAQRDAFSAP